MAVASANGAVRDLTYGNRMPERRAHLVSLLPALAGFGVYAGWLGRRWPLRTGRDAVLVGLTWATAGFAFEVGLGRAVRHASWDEIRDHYDPQAGGTGLLVLAGAAAMPLLVRQAFRGCAGRERPQA